MRLSRNTPDKPYFANPMLLSKKAFLALGMPRLRKVRFGSFSCIDLTGVYKLLLAGNNVSSKGFLN